MKELHTIERLGDAKVLLHPARVELLERLRRPRACAQLAREMDLSPQNVNNHLARLREAGLIEVASRRRKRHLIEKTYRSVAKAFWLSQDLAKPMGEDHRKAQERLSLHNLLRMSEELQQDASGLLSKGGDEEIPSIGVTAEIRLRGEQERKAFTRDYLRAMHALLERYQGPGGGRYKAMLVCYPQPGEKR